MHLVRNLWISQVFIQTTVCSVKNRLISFLLWLMESSTGSKNVDPDAKAINARNLSPQRPRTLLFQFRVSSGRKLNYVGLCLTPARCAILSTYQMAVNFVNGLGKKCCALNGTPTPVVSDYHEINLLSGLGGCRGRKK